MSCVEQQALLYQLPDGRFQIVDKGALAPMMTGHEYVLVEEDFAGYLRSLNLPQLKVVAAVIYDPRQNREIRTHEQLLIGERFSWDPAFECDLDGERILLMEGTYVFVSPTLKERLESSPFQYLRFSEGMRGFAGGP